MEYAIQELTNWSRNFSRSQDLKDISKAYKEAAESLKNKKPYTASEDVINDLNDSLNRVLEGLKNWGVDHQEAKNRQIKKADDLKKALQLFNRKI